MALTAITLPEIIDLGESYLPMTARRKAATFLLCSSNVLEKNAFKQYRALYAKIETIGFYRN